MSTLPLLTKFEPAVPSQSLAAQAHDRLLDMILDGRLAGGTVVRERALAEALGISRTPVREALGRLESEDLLTRASPRVLVVNQITISDFMDILSARQNLEAEAVALAVGRLPQDVIDELTATIRELRQRQSVAPDDHRRLDDRVHETIARASGNKVIAKFITELRRRTAVFDMKQIPERFQPSCAEHLAILEAIGRGDVQAARAGMIAHIDNVRQSILQRLGESRPTNLDDYPGVP